MENKIIYFINYNNKKLGIRRITKNNQGERKARQLKQVPRKNYMIIIKWTTGRLKRECMI